VLGRLLPGKLDILFVSGNHADLLSRLNRAGISVYNLTEVDELTAQCRIRRQDYKYFLQISSKTGAEVTVLGESGLNQYVKRALRRAVLTVGILALILCTSYLPSRILFVHVQGNSKMPTEKIIERAEECGIYFGASRKDVRSEKVKNALISALPELQWVGVNTYGCVAEISVREKTLPSEDRVESGISSIVAATDGIIRDLTVTQGNALCKVGQAVKKGQVIISGYTDCGLLLIGTQAQGEVYAETKRSNAAVTPLMYSKREVQTEKNKKFSLLIGKKLIKFYNDSGISHTSCVKMYKKEYLMLPGGFRLPVAFITETVINYRSTDAYEAEPQDFDWLSEASKYYLLTQTVAGKLLATEEQRSLNNGTCTIQGDYTCFEMIGRIQNEESRLKDGSNG